MPKSSLKHIQFYVYVCFGFIVPIENFTYIEHLLPLSSEGSLACHTYCVTGHPLIMVISEEPWRRAFGSGAVSTCFNYLDLSRLGFKHLTFRLRDEHSYPLRHGLGLRSGKGQRKLELMLYCVNKICDNHPGDIIV